MDIPAILISAQMSNNLIRLIMNKKGKKLHSSEKHALLVQSNLEEIKKYFIYVRELLESGELYPVDLDKVWPLVYSQKHHATEVLKKEFYEFF